MSIELTRDHRDTLDFLWRMYCMDTFDRSRPFGGMTREPFGSDLIEAGLAAQNPEYEAYTYITQAGADYLGFGETIITTPFDVMDESENAK